MTAVDKSYSRAKCTLESVDAYELRHMGISLEDIGARYGVSADGARKRVKMVERLISDGKLDEKVRDAKKTLLAYQVQDLCSNQVELRERLPVRCVSGCRFSRLY